ncbi:hypothetical protein FKM82_019712 [Ascaphus truei]
MLPLFLLMYAHKTFWNVYIVFLNRGCMCLQTESKKEELLTSFFYDRLHRRVSVRMIKDTFPRTQLKAIFRHGWPIHPPRRTMSVLHCIKRYQTSPNRECNIRNVAQSFRPVRPGEVSLPLRGDWYWRRLVH